MRDVIRSSEASNYSPRSNIWDRGGAAPGVAAGVDIELPTVLIEGNGRYLLTAEPGLPRPRLRFRPPEVGRRRPRRPRGM